MLKKLVNVSNYKKNNFVLKDIRRRTYFKKKELFLLALKSLLKTEQLNTLLLVWIFSIYTQLNRLFFLTKIKNFCVVTMKSKGVFFKLGGLSRMAVRSFLNDGIFFFFQRL